jgi:hypothetical protein
MSFTAREKCAAVGVACGFSGIVPLVGPVALAAGVMGLLYRPAGEDIFTVSGLWMSVALGLAGTAWTAWILYLIATFQLTFI